MDQLLAIRVFVRIADAGSFASAADSLNLPRSSVSKLMQDLEEHLCAKLVERSTRALTITPEGEAYREQAASLLATLEEMDAAATRARASPRGKLRVDIGSSLANGIIIPALPDFHARYPDVELLLGVSDRPVDLIGDGVDCVIRGGALADSSLIARRLCELTSVTCATPGYLAEHGMPSHPSELASAHSAISYFFPHTGKSLPLRFTRGDEALEIVARSVLSVSESTAQIGAVLAGLGIGQIFAFGCRVITGGTTGIGLAAAKLFVAEGAHVFITGRRHDALKAAEAEIGRNVTGIQADSSSHEDLDRLMETIGKEAGRIDVLFANAGGGTMLPLGQITEQQVDDTFDRNVKGMIFTVQKALPLLGNGSSVILAGSSASIEGTAAFSVYSASKAAVRNLARSWALDLKGTGIRVNVVSPGPVRTPFLLDFAGADPAQQQGMLDYLGTRVPLGRVGEPDEIARVALFLASEDASFVNGAEIFADGGQAQV